jgi:hypothetical protein
MALAVLAITGLLEGVGVFHVGHIMGLNLGGEQSQPGGN